MAFRNLTPAIPGFYSDPTMCAGPDAVYLANSSFEYFPGAPVFRSVDMTSFDQVGNVLHRADQLDLATFAGASAGLFGSTIRYHDGLFWFITTNIAQVREGQAIFTASEPAGPWSDPVFVPGTVGIDPDLCWDADGTCYLTWCGFPDGIVQVEIDPRSGATLSERRKLWAGTGMKAPEGPHLFHVGEWWYLLIAEGGTERGHCVTVARARRPDGGFEPCPNNPILTHRSTDHPVQSVGHADLVEWKGRWWACYHGTRPHGMTPEFHVLGRETMVCPVDWVDGWPVFREDEALTYEVDTSFDDDFAGGLSVRWVSPQGDLGNARTTAAGLVLDAGRPVVVRVQDHTWVADASVDVGEGTARLLVYLDDDHWFGVEADADGVRAVGHSVPFHQEFGRAEVGDAASVTLRIAVVLPSGGPMMRPGAPDLVTLAVVDGEAVTDLATLDGRHLSTEVAGGFTGRTVGVECLSGTVTVRRFEYRALEAAPAPTLADIIVAHHDA